MIPVHQGCPREAPAEHGVHAASASKLKAGWHGLALDRFGHCSGLKPALRHHADHPNTARHSTMDTITLTASAVSPAMTA